MDGESQFCAHGSTYSILFTGQHILFLIPIHFGVHWATVDIDFTAKEMVYYDSKPNKITTIMPPPCLYNIRYVVRQNFMYYVSTCKQKT